MTVTNRIIDNPPDPEKLIESMRSIGYSLETALADIIDNSITAQSKTIKIFVETSGSDKKLALIDDGSGLDEATLIQAMQIGSRNPNDLNSKNDLGRFGLGLKTASFSQCRRLTVISRQNGKSTGAIWDLDYMAQTNSWGLQMIDDTTDIPWINELNEQNGTLVLWEQMDRLENPDGSAMGDEDFRASLVDAREHIELVFHRYLAGEPGLLKLRILFNNNELVPFDPFNSKNIKTIQAAEEPIKIGDQTVLMRNFTLPHKSTISPREWDSYAGKEGYLKNQGFYVYREKRLIIHGTWFRLLRQSVVNQLTRIRIDIPNALDSHWKIDIKKSSAELPYQVKNRVRTLTNTLLKPARDVINHQGSKRVNDDRIPVWERWQDKDRIYYRASQDHPLVIDFMKNMTQEKQHELSNILEVIGATLPLETLFSDMAGEIQVENNLPDESLETLVRTTFNHFKGLNYDIDTITDMMKSAYPFTEKWDATQKIIKSLST